MLDTVYTLRARLITGKNILDSILQSGGLSTEGNAWDYASLSFSGDDVTVSVRFRTSESEEGNAAAETLKRLVTVRRSIGGKWTKHYYGSQMEQRQEIDGVNIELSADREITCHKVVTGIEEIPERIIPASTREIVEWICDE